MTKSKKSALFARWFWLVYLPLGLLIAAFILFIARILPTQGLPILIALSLWGLVSVKLLLERRRLGLEIPPPRNVIIWLSSITALVLIGGVLFWFGADRLSSNGGIIMVIAGGFLMILAVTAPTFKLIDVAFRRFGRFIKRILYPATSATARKRERA